MQARTTARDFARWLEQQGGSWHVEGEPTLARSLPVPAPAAALAEALVRRDGLLALLVPESAGHVPTGALLAMHELPLAAHDIEGQRVFQLAWIAPDGGQADSWLVAEQLRTPTGSVRAVDSGREARDLLARLKPR